MEQKSVDKSMDRDIRTHAIIGAAMEVHRTVGPGHLEAVYQECLEIELKLRDIPFISQPRLEIFYKEQKLKIEFYQMDYRGLKTKQNNRNNYWGGYWHSQSIRTRTS